MNTSKWSISDNEIVQEVTNAFNWNWQVPVKKVKVIVEDGWITLEGDLNWNYQREAADKSVADLVGVKGVTNNLTIHSETHNDIEKHKIEMELVNDWSINNDKILVNVSGPIVTLCGSVDSEFQKVEAGRIAWNCVGVWIVFNELVIENQD